ncbi:hypothetical protein CTA2_7399 [Colletotrichum tanaceti]|uniref:Uncharacterized protein n=1 Tax=Colletotrichum tanaceti TaxID=1306861 RepID=A0A4V6DGP7_9PEZI|nr:hypothetical protein CTA2_7399 [Colletotrichum tanaceti]TKW53276.1 hypothetical protein CTA1_298 [Colletotrichum tanaceti]
MYTLLPAGTAGALSGYSKTLIRSIAQRISREVLTGPQTETTVWDSHEQQHVFDPVSVLLAIFDNDTCLPDPAHVRGPGGHPALVVNAFRL